MNSKGISHIEVILSFLIFIGFVMFAFYFFSPFEGTRIIESSKEYAFIDLMKNTSVELDSYPVGLDVNTKGKGIIEITISQINAEKKVRVENYLGEEIPSRRDNDIIRVKLEDSIYDSFDGGGDGFILIKFSEDILSYSGPVDLSGPSLNDENLIEIGVASKRAIVSEKRIIDLKTIYESSSQQYEKLGEYLNLPKRINFGFGIIFDDGEKIETLKDIPAGIDIFSKKGRVETLRTKSGKEGKVEFSEFIVKIW